MRFQSLLMLAFVGLIAVAVSSCGVDAAERPPNIVLILSDDLGWRDVGFMGNEFVETPHLDQLAKSGVVFTQAYASAPNCAPTRACLMSGKWTPRHGVYTVVDPRQPPGSPWHRLQAAESKAELATDFVTVAEALAARGYATAFFGMWNLGRGRRGPVTPGGQGFQTVVFPESIGFGKDEYFDDQGNYLSDRLTDEVLKFTEANRERPFLVYLADHAVHAPFNPKPNLREKYQRKADASQDRRNDPDYAATIQAVDDNVGRIVDWLKRRELADDTVIVFTSDNGGTSRYNSPLRGGKGELYEGGIRVPLMMSGPRFAKPGLKVTNPVSTIDLYPTLLEWAGGDDVRARGLDGVSLSAAANGGEPLVDRPLFWHFPCYVGRATPASAVRVGDWKLVEFFEQGGKYELYNLHDDPREMHDLASTEIAKSNELASILKQWQERTQAALPRGENPQYDPKARRIRGEVAR